MSAAPDGLTEFCHLADLPDGSIRRARVGGRAVAVARRGDELIAFHPTCPHRGGPLERGRIVPLLTGGEPGALCLAGDRAVLACPWHGWEFRLDNGESVVDPAVSLRTYPCEVRDERVFVDLRRRGDRSDASTTGPIGAAR